MIEGGGLGRVDPDDVGPVEVQARNGVVDYVAADEAEATVVAKRLLSYFQGATEPGPAPDQALLRDLVPERARRAYARIGPMVCELDGPTPILYSSNRLVVTHEIVGQ